MRGGRRSAYISLWVFALAFGVIEATVVVYLREVYLRQVALHGTSDFSGLEITLVSLSDHLVNLEMVREACTIILLGAGAWLAGRRTADRVGAFLLSFGIWDLAYYAVLKVVANWPNSLRTWDILFLIPLPWVAPIWAPITVATLFIAAGSYLFWTSERERMYGWVDAAALSTAALVTIAAFLVESKAAVDHRVPEAFPLWVFWSGVAIGMTVFLRAERRVAPTPGRRVPWVDVQVRTILPTRTRSSGETNEAAAVAQVTGEEADVLRLSSEYAAAQRRLEALLNEAGELGERLERLAHGLSAHPARMIVGLPDPLIDDAREWDVVPDHSLPPIESVAALVNEIREVTAKVDNLRERLILTGRGELIEQPDGFFR